MQQQTQGKRWVGKGKMLHTGTMAFDSAIGFAMRRYTNPDESLLVSLGITAAETAAWFFAPTVMWTYTGLQLAKAAGSAIQNYRLQSYEEQFAKNARLGIIGGNFQDTDFAYTSRQRGLMAIQQSRLNARSALANEARSLHRF